VQVLRVVVRGVPVQPADRCIEVPAADQRPRDAVRLVAREVGTEALSRPGPAEHLGKAVHRSVEIAPLVTTGSEHANQGCVIAHSGEVPSLPGKKTALPVTLLIFEAL
jgi:hypothetical protein